MDSLKTKPAGELATLFVTSSHIGRVAYLTAGKALIALTAALQGNEKAAKTRLLKAGAKESDIRNGRQLALVWVEFVEAGHMTEAQFDQLRYLDAVGLRKAASLRGMEFAIANLGDMAEIAHIAEHGTTTAEAQASRERAAKPGKVSVTATATAPAEATTAPETSVATAAPSNVVPGPGAETTAPATETTTARPAKGKDKRAEVMRLVEATEAAALDYLTDSSLTPEGMQALVDRIIAMGQTVTTAAAQVQEAAQAAA
jgi:hypothetical protein